MCTKFISYIEKNKEFEDFYKDFGTILDPKEMSDQMDGLDDLETLFESYMFLAEESEEEDPLAFMVSYIYQNRYEFVRFNLSKCLYQERHLAEFLIRWTDYVTNIIDYALEADDDYKRDIKDHLWFLATDYFLYYDTMLDMLEYMY